MTRIVGISLVRDEDVFVERALSNVLDFCDELIVLDHGSRDRTPEILARLASSEPKIRVHAIRDLRLSHEHVARFAGEPVWVLAVDGDELHDPERLAKLREQILAGELDEWWSLTGNIVHANRVESGRAAGYMSPPSRTLAKLLNFGALESWDGPTPERLHGGNPRFKPGWDASRRYELHLEHSWDESPFRWLHVCFLRRSSRQPPGAQVKANPAARYYAGRVRRLRDTLMRELRRSREDGGKVEAYTRGELVEVDARPFFPE